MTIGVDGNEANVKNRVGSGTYAFELLKQFARVTPTRHSGERKRHQNLDSEPFNVQGKQVRMTKFLVYLKDQPLPELPRESENFQYKVFGPKKFWTQFALPLKLTFGDKLDVFFSMAHYGPRYSKVPYVVTIHDLSYLHYPKMFKKEDLLQLTSWSKYSIEKSAHIIAVSKTTKDDIVKNYHVQTSKITVTYEGYDESRFKPQPTSRSDLVKKKYKIAGDYIIFVGTLQPRKNLERLLEAFSKLGVRPLTGVDPLKLVIAGKKGWLYEPIFEKVKDLNLEDRVIFTDFVPDEDLPLLISGAVVYVLPSLWEGFGIPVIEAQACGVPVVVSNTSSLPEIVGDSAILIDPESPESIADSIKKAIDYATRSDLVKKGFANVKRFSWENCAKDTLEVLTKVASKSTPL